MWKVYIPIAKKKKAFCSNIIFIGYKYPLGQPKMAHFPLSFFGQKDIPEFRRRGRPPRFRSFEGYLDAPAKKIRYFPRNTIYHQEELALILSPGWQT